MMLRMLSASGGVGDVFFFISHTGRTRVLVEAAELARQTEATVVSLTCGESPLAAQSHCCINDVEEVRAIHAHDLSLSAIGDSGRAASGVTLRRG